MRRQGEPILSGVAMAIALAIAYATVAAGQRAPGGPAGPSEFDAFYTLGPDSFPREGVPKGEVHGPFRLPRSGPLSDLKGGYVYPEKVLASEKEPIRIFMIDGRNDNRGTNGKDEYDPHRDWFFQNVRLMEALTKKGYDVNYSWGMGVHSHNMGGAMLPEMMRWLWRDQPISLDPHDTVERSFRSKK